MCYVRLSLCFEKSFFRPFCFHFVECLMSVGKIHVYILIFPSLKPPIYTWEKAVQFVIRSYFLNINVVRACYFFPLGVLVGMRNLDLSTRVS